MEILATGCLTTIMLGDAKRDSRKRGPTSYLYLNELRILANSHECVLNWNITSPAPNPTSIGRHTDTAITWCYPLPTKMLRNHLAPAVCYARPGGCVVIIPWDRYIRSLVNSSNCRLEASPFRAAKAVLLHDPRGGAARSDNLLGSPRLALLLSRPLF